MKLFDALINAELILETAKSLGAETDDLRCQISTLNNKNDLAVKSIPYSTIRELLFTSLQRTGAKNFWFDMTSQFDSKAMIGILAYSTVTSPTLRDAIEYGYGILSSLSNIQSIKLNCTDP
ncbi:MAG: hypothetical protein OEX12_12630, partial [Gammaproteobacteria bacterium]|nr:hypothetical protein [Gammaproteobacteria bacterium]